LWSNDLEGYKQIITKAKSLGQKVLLKPHVVVDKKTMNKGKLHSEVTWRGDIKPKSYWDWKTLDEAYKSFMIEMATFAQAEKIEMLCIGTEMKTFVNARPKFWTKLIAEVRTIYSGQLIYSANWDNYGEIPFWESLDYIGINNYFPISGEEIPSIQKVKSNWIPIKNELKWFLWNWNYRPLTIGNTDFSVQNKPALELVKEYFTKSL